MPEQEKLSSPAGKLARWLEVQVITEEVHSELDAQVRQFGDHLSADDMPDNRDELVQLAARVIQTIFLLDRKARADAGG